MWLIGSHNIADLYASKTERGITKRWLPERNLRPSSVGHLATICRKIMED